MKSKYIVYNIQDLIKTANKLKDSEIIFIDEPFNCDIKKSNELAEKARRHFKIK